MSYMVCFFSSEALLVRWEYGTIWGKTTDIHRAFESRASFGVVDQNQRLYIKDGQSHCDITNCLAKPCYEGFLQF